MQIDWAQFTPWDSLAGFILIGLASIALRCSSAASAGSSPRRCARRKGSGLARCVCCRPASIYSLAITLAALQIDASGPLLVATGVLAGIATRYGSGCTSGHGVCGLSRFSPRSLMATLAFMTDAAADANVSLGVVLAGIGTVYTG